MFWYVFKSNLLQFSMSLREERRYLRNSKKYVPGKMSINAILGNISK